MSRTLLLVIVSAGLAAPALAADRPAPVSRAAELRAADTAGVVGYVAQADMLIEAPLYSHRTGWKAWVVTRDGKPVDTHVLAMTTDGKPAPAAEKAKLQAQINESQRKDPDGMDLPLDRKHLGSYVYSAASCQGCEPGAQAFAFRGTVRDQRHGDGQLELSKDGRFRKLSFKPCQNPPKVSSAEVSLEAGPVGPGWWGVTKFHARYAGGVGPVRGAMTLDQRQSGFKRFPGVEAAKAAGR